MSDEFETLSKGLQSPADRHFSVTPNDSADLAVLPRSIFVGGAGDVAIVDADGVEVTYVGLSGMLPFRPTRIKATGTTATGIVGIY